MPRYLTAALLIGLAPSALLAQANQANVSTTRQQYLQYEDTRFRQMDADKNGQATRAEFEAFQRAQMVAQARARNQALFAQLDADKNGQISPAEFARIDSGAPAVDARTTIAAIDTNKDGQVSLVEYRTARLTNFDRIDADKDGVATAAEMRAAGIIR